MSLLALMQTTYAPHSLVQVCVALLEDSNVRITTAHNTATAQVDLKVLKPRAERNREQGSPLQGLEETILILESLIFDGKENMETLWFNISTDELCIDVIADKYFKVLAGLILEETNRGYIYYGNRPAKVAGEYLGV